jgi:hypothetical protein
MTRLKQILTVNRQLKGLGEMPTQPGIHGSVGMYPLHGQRADTTVSRVKLKSPGQIEKYPRSYLIMRT